MSKAGIYQSKTFALEESVAAAVTPGGVLLEDLVNLDKTPRAPDEAKEAAAAAAVRGFNPYDVLLQRHKDARDAVYKAVGNEFKKAKTKEEKITVSVNFIRSGQYVQPENSLLLIGVHVYMPVKKGFFARLFTGSIGNWFTHVGVAALRAYVEVFGGKEYAKQITSKNVFNAKGEGANEGKVSYFCCLKIPTVKS